jgi:hypothetical protein
MSSASLAYHSSKMDAHSMLGSVKRHIEELVCETQGFVVQEMFLYRPIVTSSHVELNAY